MQTVVALSPVTIWSLALAEECESTKSHDFDARKLLAKGPKPFALTVPFKLFGLPLGYQIPYGFGFAVDDSLKMNVGTYPYAGLVGEAGKGADGGISFHYLNLKTIFVLSGPFMNYSVCLFDGPGASIDYFDGLSSNGPVKGGGFSFGAEKGASVSSGKTDIIVCTSITNCVN